MGLLSKMTADSTPQKDPGDDVLLLHGLMLMAGSDGVGLSTLSGSGFRAAFSLAFAACRLRIPISQGRSGLLGSKLSALWMAVRNVA